MLDEVDLQAYLDELHTKMSQADRDRAYWAFLEVIKDAGFDPDEAALSESKIQDWVESGFSEGEVNEGEAVAATTWCMAVEAARAELCDKAPYLSEEAFCFVDFLNPEKPSPAPAVVA
jgi:hypothetical protein